MKKVENAAASDNAAGDGWFKIMENGYDEATQEWCTAKLVASNGHMAATIPSGLQPGYYLMRTEILALHAAQASPPDPQFFVGCAQIFLSSGGSDTPKNTVSIPGYVDMNTPALTFNVYKEPLDLPFPNYGPPVYTAGNSKRDLEKRDMTQQYGLKPDNCALQNANWCGYIPPKYTDQDGCWAVRSSPPRER